MSELPKFRGQSYSGAGFATLVSLARRPTRQRSTAGQLEALRRRSTAAPPSRDNPPAQGSLDGLFDFGANTGQGKAYGNAPNGGAYVVDPASGQPAGS